MKTDNWLGDVPPLLGLSTSSKLDFEKVRMLNPFVKYVMDNRYLSLEDKMRMCVVYLSNLNDELADENIRLSRLIPKRYKLPDGTEYIYRVPDDQIPVINEGLEDV